MPQRQSRNVSGVASKKYQQTKFTDKMIEEVKDDPATRVLQHNDGDFAFAQLDSENRVIITKLDNTQKVYDVHRTDEGFTLEDTINLFIDAGDWELVGNNPVQVEVKKFVEAKLTSTSTPKVETMALDKQMVDELDEYIKLHKQKKELESKLEKIKKKVKPFMEENKIASIKTSTGDLVELQPAVASNSTSRFTDYSLLRIQERLTYAEFQKVTTTVVDKQKIEEFIEELSKDKDDHSQARAQDLKSARIFTEGTPRFSVVKAPKDKK
jgi:hypothetical protein